MSVADFHHILKEVMPLTGEVCLHVTGEPLVHPNFLEMLGLCEKMQIKVQLTTNGLLLESVENALLKSPAIRQINFSLQALMDNFPDRKIANHLLPFLDFIKRGCALRPEMYFNLRLWNQGYHVFENAEVFDIVEKYFQIIIKRTVDVGGIKSKRIWNRLYLHFDSRFDWPSLDNQYLGEVGTCKGLVDHIGVLSNGEVIPCCLDKDGVISLGNCLKEPLENILNSKKANRMREGFKKGVLVETLCQHCSYIRRFTK